MPAVKDTAMYEAMKTSGANMMVRALFRPPPPHRCEGFALEGRCSQHCEAGGFGDADCGSKQQLDRQLPNSGSPRAHNRGDVSPASAQMQPMPVLP